MKVLHVLSALGQGGIEKWLVNLTVELQREHGGEVESEFLTYLSPGGYYRGTLEAMGCRVHHCQLVWRKLPGFVLRLAALLQRGHYDVVHCHADYLSGLILPVARAVGVATRLSHIHNTEFAFQARRPLLRHGFGRLLRRMNVWDGGVCVGTSAAAIDAYLGPLTNLIRHQVSVCGIPCADYRAAVNTEKRALRASLDWPMNSNVLLHVGRHSDQKNLLFLLEVVAAVLRRDPSVTCLLAGSGPLSAALQTKALDLGIAEKVRFLGSRDDVPHLMRAADLLLLPSRFEGLGLVLIEAQAVGLASLISEIVPTEVEVVDGLVHRASLSETPDKWAERALEILQLPLPDPRVALQAVEASPFNITHSAESLMKLYRREEGE